MHQTSFFAFVLISAAVFVPGCSGGPHDRPELHPVSGTVTYQGDPVEGAHVTFYTEQSPRAARGVTDQQGNFELTTFATGDGAVAGEHRITIRKRAEADETESIEYDPDDPSGAYGEAMQASAQDEGEEELSLPEVYADRSTTPLTREIIAGERNDFTFELD